jgi:hypothetical protein
MWLEKEILKVGGNVLYVLWIHMEVVKSKRITEIIVIIITTIIPTVTANFK